jgi:hypothetical protein
MLHAPDFARAVRRAAKAGVSFRALRFRPEVQGVWLDAEVPVELEDYDVEALTPRSSTAPGPRRRAPAAVD